MNRERINAAIAEERRRIADLIAGLDDAQLATETLCAGWDVKTMGAHLVMPLENGIFESFVLSLRRGSTARALDELTRRGAQRPAAEIAATLRDLADRQYWRPPPQVPGRLAEILCHSGDIRIPLGFPFEPDPQLTAIALDYLTGPVLLAFPFVTVGRLRGILLRASDLDRTWGKGHEVRGRAADLMMAVVGRTATLDGLDGPGVPLLSQRISR